MLLGQIRLTKAPTAWWSPAAAATCGPATAAATARTSLYLGPVVLSPGEAERRTVHRTDPSGYRALCSKRLDWIEVVKPATPAQERSAG